MNSIGQPSYDQLLAENARLRQQLSEKRKGLHVDVDSGLVEIHDLKGPGIQVDELQLQVTGLSKLATPLLNPSNLQKPAQVPAQLGRLLAEIPKYPMKVQSARLKVSEDTANQMLSQRPVPGASNVKLSFEPNGQIRLTGSVRKAFFNVPFEVKGKLAPGSNGDVRFRLDSTRVANFLPLPNLMTNFFASLASRELQQAQIRQDAGDFVVSTKDMVPSNIDLQLTALKVEDGFLTLESKPPKTT